MGRVAGIKNSLIRCIIGLSKRFNVPERNVKERPERFLIVSTTGIGDILWGTPAIRALKEAYPDSYIGLLTTATGCELLKGNPYIDRFFIFKRGLRVLTLLKLLKELRQERFGVAFIFHASDRIIWPLVFLTGTPQIIGIVGQSKGLDFILTKAIEQDNVHGVDMRLRLVGEAGASRKNESAPALYLSEAETIDASKFLETLGFDENFTIIGFHPGAQKPFKCWPAERFIETGRRLVKDIGCKVIITGDRNEKGLCEYIASQIPGAVSVAGKANLRETAAIIEKMHLFITNDTGPMHMAFALGTPTVAIFCPTNPGLCGPYNAKDVVIIKRPVTCNPCIGKECQRPVCMGQITVEEVVEGAELLLKVERRYADNAG